MALASLARILRSALPVVVPCVLGIGVASLASGQSAPAAAAPAGPTADWAPEAKALRDKQKASLGEYAPAADGKYQVPVSRAMEMVIADNALLKPITMQLVIPATAEERGAQLFNKIMPCYTCHVVDAADTTVKLGPHLHGRWGKPAKYVGGETTFDEAHVIESIKTPLAKIAEGFPPVMPPLGLTDDQINDIVAYLKTLK